MRSSMEFLLHRWWRETASICFEVSQTLSSIPYGLSLQLRSLEMVEMSDRREVRRIHIVLIRGARHEGALELYVRQSRQGRGDITTKTAH